MPDLFTTESSRKDAAGIDALLDAVVRAKPSGAKGKYLRKIAVSSTMGPGIRVDVTEVAGA